MSPTHADARVDEHPGGAIDEEARHRVALRCWMTHDAMWFGEAVARCGIDTANDMNCAAVRAMARIEARRVCKAAGLGPVTTIGDLQRFVEAASAIVIPDAIRFAVTWSPQDRTITFDIQRCFAHDGVAAAGLIEQYRCGIYPRVMGWLEELGIDYRLEPDAPGCIGAGTGACRRTFHLDVA